MVPEILVANSIEDMSCIDSIIVHYVEINTDDLCRTPDNHAYLYSYSSKDFSNLILQHLAWAAHGFAQYRNSKAAHSDSNFLALHSKYLQEMWILTARW